MTAVLSYNIAPGELWLLVGFLAALLVWTCLKHLAQQIEHETKWHDLKVEAHHLKLKQTQRLRALGVKSRR